MELHSYSSPFTVGHRALARLEDRPGIFEVPVFVEEKIDGSQLSFTRLGSEIHFRSRRAVVYPESAGMFLPGVQSILEIADKLTEGWTYRGEYLAKPKHNTLAYTRVPQKYTILFDIETVPNTFLPPEEREVEAARLGLECVPVYFTGRVDHLDQLRAYFHQDSVLGGVIEGLVIKPIGHALWGPDKKVLMAKFVREDFKEKHEKEWKSSNPGRGDVVLEIIKELRTPQRWMKAVQHLREAGELEGSPRDIGKLFKEVPEDIYKDEAEALRERLFQHFWKQIGRGVTAGLAEWYKTKLAADAFENPREFVAHESVTVPGEGASPNG